MTRSCPKKVLAESHSCRNREGAVTKSARDYEEGKGGHTDPPLQVDNDHVEEQNGGHEGSPLWLVAHFR